MKYRLLVLGCCVLGFVSLSSLAAQSVETAVGEFPGRVNVEFLDTAGGPLAPEEIGTLEVWWRGRRFAPRATNEPGVFEAHGDVLSIEKLPKKFREEIRVNVRASGIRDVAVWLPLSSSSTNPIVDLPAHVKSARCETGESADAIEQTLTVALRVQRFSGEARFQLLSEVDAAPVVGALLECSVYCSANNLHSDPVVGVTTDDQGVFTIHRVDKEFRIFFRSPGKSHVAYRVGSIELAIGRDQPLLVTQLRGRPKLSHGGGPVAYNRDNGLVRLVWRRDTACSVKLADGKRPTLDEPVWLSVRPLDLVSEPIALESVALGRVLGKSHLDFVNSGVLSLESIPFGEYQITCIAPSFGSFQGALAVAGDANTAILSLAGQSAAGPIAKQESGFWLWVSGRVPPTLGSSLASWAWQEPLAVKSSEAMAWIDFSSLAGFRTQDGEYSLVTQSGEVSVWSVSGKQAERLKLGGVMGRVESSTLEAGAGSEIRMVALTTLWGGEGTLLLPEPKRDEIPAVSNLGGDGSFELVGYAPGVYTFCVARWRKSTKKSETLWEISMFRPSIRNVRIGRGIVDLGSITLSGTGWEPYSAWRQIREVNSD